MWGNQAGQFVFAATVLSWAHMIIMHCFLTLRQVPASGGRRCCLGCLRHPSLPVTATQPACQLLRKRLLITKHAMRGGGGITPCKVLPGWTSWFIFYLYLPKWCALCPSRLNCHCWAGRQAGPGCHGNYFNSGRHVRVVSTGRGEVRLPAPHHLTVCQGPRDGGPCTV